MMMYLNKIIPCSLVAILLSCSEVKLPDFDVYAEGQKEVLDAFGFTFDPSLIRHETIKEDFHVIFGFGGNILISIGEDGVLAIDSQFPQIYEALLAKIESLGGSGINHIINTHWHFDHADGNRAFGPLGEEIYAHINSLNYMKSGASINLVGAVYPQQPYEKEALATVTYKDTLDLNLNGQTIKLMNFGPAHTTGDTVIFFKEANIIHTGDLTNLDGLPFIDADNGGTLEGMISSLYRVLELIDDDTIVVPGHGPVADKDTIKSFLMKLVAVNNRIDALVGQGKSAQEILEMNPAKEIIEEAPFPILVNRALVGKGLL